MVWSFAYLAVRSLFAFVLLLGRSDRSKELEILVLRHELTVLRRGSRPPRIEPADRLADHAKSGASSPGVGGILSAPGDAAALAPALGSATLDVFTQQAGTAAIGIAAA